MFSPQKMFTAITNTASRALLMLYVFCLYIFIIMQYVHVVIGILCTNYARDLVDLYLIYSRMHLLLLSIGLLLVCSVYNALIILLVLFRCESHVASANFITNIIQF
ncbi:hypothetical protein I3843_03G114000 [Carya illinoinensis]|nr:hypothetical protein I3843_03G114000 [Carya illinoinensis]